MINRAKKKICLSNIDLKDVILAVNKSIKFIVKYRRFITRGKMRKHFGKSPKRERCFVYYMEALVELP